MNSKLRITPEEFKLFRDFIERHCGILLGPDKAYLIEHRLTKMMHELDCGSYRTLFDLAGKDAGCGQLCTRIIDAITTNETAWFRDARQFEALGSHLIPELWETIRKGRRPGFNIWSAACSTGQEPYTIAISILNFLEKATGSLDAGKFFKILATDISERSLHAAVDGRYDAQAMKRGLAPPLVKRYFRKTNDLWRINDEVKKLVDFKRFNLQMPLTGFGPFDIVFLRNVIIYFSDGLKKTLLERVADRLQPGGWLFLGTGETVTGYCSRFEIMDKAGATFYRLK